MLTASQTFLQGKGKKEVFYVEFLRQKTRKKLHGQGKPIYSPASWARDDYFQIESLRRCTILKLLTN